MPDSSRTENMLVVHRVTAGEPPYQVEGVGLVCGRDITITVGGGTSYHVGASAVAVPRASLDDPSTPSASASVICVTGHKEDELARATALGLATELRCVVVVSMGIHIDNAAGHEIGVLLDNSRQVVTDLTRLLRGARLGPAEG